MKYILNCLVILAIALTLQGCGGKSEEELFQEKLSALPQLKQARYEELQQKLVGTQWMIGDYHVTFQDASKALVKGEPVYDLYPEGVEASYTFNQQGVLEISAMDQTKRGYWTGTELVMEGRAGEQLQ